MELDLTEIIVAFLGSAGLGAIIAWFFGGKQSHKNSVDNDSHSREKDFYNMVEQEAESRVNNTIKKIVKCSKSCKHSANCPILIQWDEDINKT